MPYAGGRVLVVDDEPIVRRLMVRALQGAGLEVIQADSGDAALALLTRDARLDLLITDVLMPGLDGFALAARVRSDWPTLPILYVSANTGYVIELLGPGAPQFLAKPFLPAAFVKFVSGHLPRM
jgi:two-component system, cell cycle sensor histidine kinase and response regulator CckA